MNAMADVKASIPKDLKRRLMVRLTEEDTKFTTWLMRQIQGYLRQPSHERPAEHQE